MDQLGGITEDLLAQHQPHPGEQTLHPDDRENRTRRFGRRSFITGLTLACGVLINSLVIAIVGEHNTFVSPIGQLFAVLAYVAIAVTAASLIVVGGIERLGRGERSRARENRAAVAANQERLDLLIGLIGPLPGRLNAIEEVIAAVPAFGEGVELGATLRRQYVPDADR
ncbi:hypothetical protein ACWKSP_22060 [Micromonosporaceae bacterium Da 78-11]